MCLIGSHLDRRPLGGLGGLDLHIQQLQIRFADLVGPHMIEDGDEGIIGLTIDLGEFDAYELNLTEYPG